MKSHHLDNVSNNYTGQQLQAVGLWLKEARELKGESLENVSNITRIGKTYLEAIEEGAADKLPSQAYTRGFIRLYAVHLGLSPDEALAMIIGQTAEVPPAQPAPKEMPSTISQPLNRRRAESGRAKKLFFLLFGAVAIAVIIIILFNSTSRKSSSPGSNPATTAPTNSATAPAPPMAAPPPPADAPPAAAPQTTAPEAAAEEGIVLRLKAVSSGRLHITIDGSVSQEYDLVAGDLVEWKAEKSFLLDLENASSVEGELDGKPLQSFGEAGKSAHLIISKSGVQKN